jgi:hypothetical protein
MSQCRATLARVTRTRFWRAIPHRPRLDQEVLWFTKATGGTRLRRLFTSANIPATGGVAITEAAGTIPAVPRRAVCTVSGDRQLRLCSARVLSHHPTTGRRRMAALARCYLIRPVVQLRQTPLSRRSGRSRRPSTAVEQWTGRRACSPPQVNQAFHVPPRQLRPATSASHRCCLISKPKGPAQDLQLLHQKCGRTTFTPPRHAPNAARCGLFLLRRS